MQLVENVNIQTTATNKTQSSVIRVFSTFAHWFTTLGKNLADAIFVGSELEVNQMVYGDQVLWSAFNPRTGDLLYTDSEVELRQWIEANYQER